MNILNDEIKVAIWMVTYNHEKYIVDAIDSVINQKTNFKFKLFIGEDYSSDNTRNICIEYKIKYPEHIELHLNKNNIGSNANGINMYQVCFNSGSEYIALLEGDDYWTDPYKLQKQVDFLEENPDVAVTYHDSKKINLNNEVIAETEVGVENRKDFTNTELQKGAWLSTRTMCFRNSLTIPKQVEKVLNGDTFLTALMGEIGHGKYMSDIKPAVYRIHDDGIWSSVSYLKKTTNKYKTFEQLHEYFADNGKTEIAEFYKKKFLIYLMRAFYQASQTGAFREMNLLILNIIKKQQFSWALITEVVKIYTWGILRKLFKK